VLVSLSFVVVPLSLYIIIHWIVGKSSIIYPLLASFSNYSGIY
jgi:hypothetical protein